MTNYEKVYKIVASIPTGKVLTYGLVAKLANLNSPRLVGKILHNNPDPVNIPCHRVVNSKGQTARTFAFGGGNEQAKRLRAEGIEIKNNSLKLEKYLWS
jgi:O-6-methylguanine DNA methyltransferase